MWNQNTRMSHLVKKQHGVKPCKTGVMKTGFFSLVYVIWLGVDMKCLSVIVIAIMFVTTNGMLFLKSQTLRVLYNPFTVTDFFSPYVFSFFCNKNEHGFFFYFYISSSISCVSISLIRPQTFILMIRKMNKKITSLYLYHV